MPEQEIRPGYYSDENGVWRKDRRREPERRNRDVPLNHHDRRAFFRRRTDLVILEREAKMQIEEALEDFAAEHEKN